jgi:glycosyltransferase involved in cell wall biosynthesis
MYTNIKMKISIIIPVYNEEKHIEECIKSLLLQNHPNYEIIVVDDGSNDKTIQILNNFASRQKIILLKQNHRGPAHARNLGNSVAGGEILVFVDGDMFFEKYFLENLVLPIISSKSKGTFSKEEYVANWNNKIAKFWQYNRGIFSDRMIEDKYIRNAPVFRAILKSEFDKVSGFDDIGYTDDWSLSRKLGYQSTSCDGAKYYHHNPETYSEVWTQAEWIGKNEFISGTFLRKIKSFLKFNLISSIIKGVITAIRFKEIGYVVFQVIYDLAIMTAIVNQIYKNNNKIK